MGQYSINITSNDIDTTAEPTQFVVGLLDPWSLCSSLKISYWRFSHILCTIGEIKARNARVHPLHGGFDQNTLSFKNFFNYQKRLD